MKLWFLHILTTRQMKELVLGKQKEGALRAIQEFTARDVAREKTVLNLMCQIQELKRKKG